jgi:hypothetical protein
MADRITKVVDAATNFDLLTLDEAKLLLGIALTDTSQDEIVTTLITSFSRMISTLCNRTFARETVIETWREMFNGRIFLSHWPVKEADIQTVSSGSVVLDNTMYELEEKSGKVSFISNPGGSQSVPWLWPAVVTYTGGYMLPDEAPFDLKQACAILIRDERMRMRQAQVAGIRQISHKESRVAFFDPNALLLRMMQLSAKGFGINPVVDNLLKHYIQIEV